MREELIKAQQEKNFLKYVDLLSKLGIKSFKMDILEGRQTFVTSENDIITLPAFSSEVEIGIVDVNEIKSIIKKHQHKELSYEEFVNLVALNGVSYWVCDLFDYQVNYFSSLGESIYSEQF